MRSRRSMERLVTLYEDSPSTLQVGGDGLLHKLSQREQNNVTEIIIFFLLGIILFNLSFFSPEISWIYHASSFRDECQNISQVRRLRSQLNP